MVFMRQPALEREKSTVNTNVADMTSGDVGRSWVGSVPILLTPWAHQGFYAVMENEVSNR